MVVRIVKGRLGVLVILAVGVVFVIAIIFGVKKYNFACTGIETADGTNSPTEFSLKVERLRGGIFWADDDGTVWLETQSGRTYLFTYFDDSGLYWSFAEKEFQSPPFGRFSTISNKALVGISDGHVLEGNCQQVADYSQ